MVRRSALSRTFLYLIAALPLPLIAETLHVAVASNFKQAHLALVDLFLESEISSNNSHDINVLTSSGSSGTLYSQIKNGAPYDIFLSADAKRPDRLIYLGLAINKSRLEYAQGQAVFWWPNVPEPLTKTSLINSLQTGRMNYVIANPNVSPFGEAAISLMEGLGLWREADRLRIKTHNIATAFQYIATEVVPMGWVAKSQLKSWEKQHTVQKGSYWLPDTHSYSPIMQVGAILSRSRVKSLAESFMAFMSAPEARSLIKYYGYLLPNKTE